MSPKIQITPERVRALKTDQVMVPPRFFKAFIGFGTEQIERINSRMIHGAAGARILPADRVIDRNELVEFLARTRGLSRLDIDMAEMYVLAIVSWKYRSRGGWFSPAALLLRNAITERVHQIIESRPEFLHPKLSFALNSGDNSETWMLHFLLASRVALDADRLHAMSIGGGVGQEMLLLSLAFAPGAGKDDGAMLFNESAYRYPGCASSITAMFRAGYDIAKINGDNIQAIIAMCAAGAAGSQWQFDQAVEMLRAIEAAQDAAGGDGHRLFRAVSGQNAVNLNDFGDASARGVHPVTTLIYETMLRAGESGTDRAADVAGFPGVPFSIMAERINAILEPAGRLPLAKLSGINALKLVTLCPAAYELGSVAAQAYWLNRSVGAKGVAALANSPMDIVDWACQKNDEDGVRLTLAEIDQIQNQLAGAIGAGATAEIRAKVTLRDMTATIAAAGRAQEAGPRRRRSPGV